MKKLGKLTLKELANSMPSIGELEQKECVGGSGLSSFEVSCLYNYVSSNGDMNLSSERFNSIASAAASIGFYSGSWVELNGTMYEALQVSFYSNGEYDLALGTATVFYDSCGNAVWFKDTYDFNAMEPGQRSAWNEFVTASGSLIPGSSYGITYGIHN